MRNIIFFVIFWIFGSDSACALSAESCAQVIAKAREMTTQEIVYNGAYFKIPYPNGDVPENIGVCTDMVIRSLRTVGIDLQQTVHEHVTANFKLYKKLYSSKAPDSNIDHRRVLNLRVFFSHTETELPITTVAQDYQPCDLVAWDLPKGFKHIGIISDKMASDGTPLIIHHIFKYPTEDNLLFVPDWKITGHYRLNEESAP